MAIARTPTWSSSSAARWREKYWPGGSPVGRRLRPVWQKEWRTIVGVVDDVKTYSIKGPPEWVDGEIYLPLTPGHRRAAKPGTGRRAWATTRPLSSRVCRE